MGRRRKDCDPAEEYRIKKAAVVAKIEKYNELERLNKLNNLSLEPPAKIKVRRSFDKSLPPKYKSYLMRAQDKEMVFDLTIEQFYSILELDCVYCGDKAETIDRKDSLDGYTIANCVPACKKCNMMKYTYPVNEFLKHIQKIKSYQLIVNQ